MDFVKYKAEELKQEFQELQQESSQTKTQQKLAVWLKKIISNFCLNNHLEMSYLYPEVYSVWKTECQKFHRDEKVSPMTHELVALTHQYLQLITTPQIVKHDTISAVLGQVHSNLHNTQQDLHLVELSLKMCIYLTHIPDFVAEAEEYVAQAIRSGNESTARLAIQSIPALPKLHTENTFDILWDNFQNDTISPTLRVVSLTTLFDIHGEKPVSLGFRDIIRVFELVDQTNEWNKSLLLAKLPTSFTPVTHDQVRQLIEVILPEMSSSNTSNVLNCLNFFMYLLNYLDELDGKTLQKLTNCIVSLLSKPNELKFLVLRNVILLLLSRKPSFFQDKLGISYFFVEIDDPIYIKDTKLEILYLMANENNVSTILNELKEYCMDIDLEMSRKAVRAIGNLAIKLENEVGVKQAIHNLLDLLAFFTNNDYILQEVVSVFRNIFRRYPQCGTPEIIETLLKCIDIVDENESRSSMIWLLTKYSYYNPSKHFDILSKYFYSDFKNFELQSFDVKCSILNSVVKFSIKLIDQSTKGIASTGLDSEKVLPTCQSVLQNCVENTSNPDIRDKALFYQRLLTAVSSSAHVITVEDCLKIVDGELPLINFDDQLDPAILESLELEIGTTASIYLKPVDQVFRSEKPKTLPDSEILHRNKLDLYISDEYDDFDTQSDTASYNRDSRPSSIRGNSVSSYDTPFNTSPMDTRFPKAVNRSRSPSTVSNKNLSDFDKPVNNVNTINRRKSLVRKPSMLAKTLSTFKS